MPEVAMQQHMTGNAYDELTSRLQRCYENFFPGAGVNIKFGGLHSLDFWNEEGRGLEYHARLSALISLAGLHQRFDGALLRRRVLSFEEGAWAINSGFDLEPEESDLLEKLNQALEAYERSYA